MTFPGITICREGLNMDAVKKALERDYEEWKSQNSRKKRSARDDSLGVFMQEKFGFSDEAGYNMQDILQSMTSPNVDASAGMNAARENMIACGIEEKRRKRSIIFSGSQVLALGKQTWLSPERTNNPGIVGSARGGGNCAVGAKIFSSELDGKYVLTLGLDTIFHAGGGVGLYAPFCSKGAYDVLMIMKFHTYEF